MNSNKCKDRKIVVFGYGTIGKELVQRLLTAGAKVKVVNIDGIYDATKNDSQGGAADDTSHKVLQKIEPAPSWQKICDEADVVCICIPTDQDGNTAFSYISYCLAKNIGVVTCEKASVAYHFEKLRSYGRLFAYTASVGGGTRMLKKLAQQLAGHPSPHAIYGVVNGTLNYIASRQNEGIESDTVVKEVLEKGFAEPGAKTFADIVKAELNDVVLKATILANSSGLYTKVITPTDVIVVPPSEDAPRKRCIVKLTPEGVTAGYIEDTDSSWLPEGVINVLYVDDTKLAEGPGAGAVATVDTIMEDIEGCL